MPSTFHRRLAAFATGLALLGAGLAHAQSAASAGEVSQAAGAAQAQVLTEGEVKKINKDAGKITIKHGEIKNLDMPPMTMVFVVRDSALLDKFQVGDKLRFVAAYEGGQMVAHELQGMR